MVGVRVIRSLAARSRNVDVYRCPQTGEKSLVLGIMGSDQLPQFIDCIFACRRVG